MKFAIGVELPPVHQRRLSSASSDQYTFAVNPVVLGDGKNAFKGVDTSELKLSESRSFKNGLVWLTYERV